MPQLEKERKRFFAQLSARDILRIVGQSGEKFHRQESILLSRIVMNRFLVDESHALQLGHAMMGDWGQTQTVEVRARLNKDEEIVYDATDGYHRIFGYGLVNPQGLGAHINSVVMYGCTDPELYDRRIIAANSVGSVRFPRVCGWIQDAWGVTPWGEIITATQAFSLIATQNSGKKLIGDEEISNQIKEWAEKKATDWRLHPTVIYSYLRTYDVADPDLVLKVRTGSFQKGELALTPSQLSSIATAFPHDRFPGVQKIIARFATGFGLSTGRIEALCTELYKLDGLTIESVQIFLEQEKNHSPKRKERLFDPKRQIERLNQVETDIKASKDLSPQRKAGLMGQIGLLIALLQGNSPNGSLENQNSHITSVSDFIAKWDNPTGTKKIEDFIRSELNTMQESDLALVLEHFTGNLVSPSVDQRDRALEVIAVSPSSRVSDEASRRILLSLSERLVQLRTAPIEIGDLSSIVETVLASLDSLNSLGLSHTTEWTTLRRSLRQIRPFVDQQCSVSILESLGVR